MRKLLSSCFLLLGLLACESQETAKVKAYQDVASIIPEVKNGQATGNDIVTCKNGSKETVPHALLTSDQVCAEKSPKIYQQLVTKNAAACAVDQKGQLECWGGGIATQVPARLGPVKKVALSSYHACAISMQDRVYCWGQNSDLQLTVPATLPTASDIAVSENATCAINARDQKIVCWGGDASTQAIPAELQGQASKLFGGESNFCAIGKDGKFKCWGKDANVNSAPLVTSPLSVSVGSRHACLVDAQRRVNCWGKNTKGQTSVPFDLAPVKAIAAGAETSCVVFDNGLSRCWGANDASQSYIPAALGPVTMLAPSSATPQYYTTEPTYPFQQNCAITGIGDVRCWSGDTITFPTRGIQVKRVFAGGSNVCAVNDQQQTVCWGAENSDMVNSSKMSWDEELELPGHYSMSKEHYCRVSSGYIMCQGRGTGKQGQAYPPEDMDGTSAKVFTGENFNCQIKNDNSVACWGDNRKGYATPPLDLGPAQEVAIGLEHACALKSDNTVRCWGSNDNGQLMVPANLGTVKSLKAGAAHTCALKENNQVQCWGRNSQRQSLPPLDLGEVLEISTGADHSCAIRKADKRAVCWGSNSEGQSAVPTGTGALSQLVSGERHNCAVRDDDRTLVCWGDNSLDQLAVPKAYPANFEYNGDTIALEKNAWISHKALEQPLVTTKFIGGSHGGYYATFVPEGAIINFGGLQEGSDVYDYTLDVSYTTNCPTEIALTINNEAPLALVNDGKVQTISNRILGSAHVYLRTRGQKSGSFGTNGVNARPDNCYFYLNNVAVKPGDVYLQHIKDTAKSLQKALDTDYNNYIILKNASFLQNQTERSVYRAMTAKLDSIVNDIRFALEDSGKYPEDYMIDSFEWSREIILKGIADSRMNPIRNDDGTMSKPITVYDFKPQVDRAPWFKDIVAKDSNLRNLLREREDDYIGYLTFLLPATKVVAPNESTEAALAKLDATIRETKLFLDAVAVIRNALSAELQLLLNPLGGRGSAAEKRCSEQGRDYITVGEGRYECQ